MSEAVYCGTCKWHREGGDGWNWAPPTCAIHESHYRDIMGDKMIDETDAFCHVHNKGCDCKNYERQWWKFWA